MREVFAALVIVAFSVNATFGQPVDRRHFYAANNDGTGVDQWVKRRGYRAIFEFFLVNATDNTYKRRVLYVFDNDPNRRPYVYHEETGRFIGRWDEGGYSNLPGWAQKSRFSQLREADFPPANLYPALPYSPDCYPRSAPPPVSDP